MSSVERVKALCKERKIPIARLEKDLGYANEYIGQLRKGVFPDNRLKEIAAYLSVSTDYLIGNETDVSNIDSGLALDHQLSGVDFALSGEIHDLTDNEKQDILDYIRFKKEPERRRQGMNLLDLYQRAESEGVEVDYFPMREIVSFSLPEGLIAMDVDKMENSREEKVLLAHELGHIETGSFYNIYSGLDIREKHERRADKEAIKMLVPKDELEKAVQAGCTELWELAEYFSVPCEFMEKAVKFYQQ